MKKKKKTGISRLLEISGAKKYLLLGSAISVIIHAILTMIPYVLIFYILIELLSGQVNNPDVYLYLKWSAIAVAISFVMFFISGALSHLAAFNILYKLRVQIASKLGKLPMGYLSNRSSGSLKKILVDDVERIESFIAHGIPDTVKAVVLPLLILIYLFTVDWRLALVSFIPLLLLLVIASMMMGTKKAKKGMEQYHQSLEDMNAGIVEYVRAMPVMKIFGQTASAFKKYNNTVNEYQLFITNWTKISAPMWGMMMSFLVNALIPILAFGLYFYFKGSLELSVFFLFVLLGVGYVKPVFALASLSPQIVMISKGVDRIDEILFDIKEQYSGEKVFTDNFNLEFRNVNFSYKEGIEVLKDVSFTVPQNSITALVGPSGSGKSTIAQLIPRFYDVNSGSITINNIDIKEYNNGELMQNIGFVFQDNMMFYQTIYENIQMGMNKTKAEVIKAAKIARCHDFIENLPNGYNTHFGDKGVHLSGGEKQRIQLARVVLKDASILILDEATAFSDPENEQLIMEAFSDIIQDKTVIIIAHRLSTITEANQIIVLDKGEVEAKGTHNELVANSKLYSKMWNAHNRVKEFEIK